MKRGLLLGVAAAMLAASGTSLAGQQWRHAGTMGMRQFVVVEQAATTDADTLRQAAGAVCPAGKACVVVFLPEGTAVPKKMPMTRAQQRAVVAQYFRNPASGRDELLLKCRAGEPRGRKCLR